MEAPSTGNVTGGTAREEENASRRGARKGRLRHMKDEGNALGGPRPSVTSF